MASSPDGLISARYAVITKTPGWEVLTTTSRGGGDGAFIKIHTKRVEMGCGLKQQVAMRKQPAKGMTQPILPTTHSTRLHKLLEHVS